MGHNDSLQLQIRDEWDADLGKYKKNLTEADKVLIKSRDALVKMGEENAVLRQELEAREKVSWGQAERSTQQ